MRTSKRHPNATWRLLRLTAVGLLLAGALTSCAGDVRPPGAMVSTSSPPLASDGDQEFAIGVLKEGWHTGLILPVAEMPPSLYGLRHWFPQAKYLAFGWGNRAFYTARQRSVGTALAALLPSPSVLFVDALPSVPKSALPPDSTVRWVCASANEVAKLDVYLGRYVKKGSGGHPISIEPGPSPDSRFFASTGDYDAFHTCNTWTMAGLEFAGLPVSAEGVVFSSQVVTRTKALPVCRVQAAKLQTSMRTQQDESTSTLHAATG